MVTMPGNDFKPTIYKVLYGAVGMLAGIGLLFGSHSLSTESSTFINYFPRNQAPALIRIYKPHAVDLIYVEDKSKVGKFIPLEQHLNKIVNPSDRMIEQGTIENIVGWHQ